MQIALLASARPSTKGALIRRLASGLRRLLPALRRSEAIQDLSDQMLSDLGIERMPTRDSHRHYFDAEAQLGMFR